MKTIITILAYASLLISFNNFAANGGASGLVKSITIKETGYILIELESSHANPGNCERNKMIAIANNHIAKKEILSVVLSAHAANKPVSFWVTSCYQGYGTSYPQAIVAAIHQE